MYEVLLERRVLKTISTFILLLLPLILSASPKAPDWVENLGESSSYPELAYLTGFGMAMSGDKFDESECLNQAMEYARKDLIEGIRVSIRSEVTSLAEETDAKYSSYFSSATKSTSNLEVYGLQTKTFFDKKKKTGYAIAFIKRETLEKTYSDKATNLRSDIRNHLLIGQEHQKDGRKAEALEEYLSCYPLFRQLEDVEAVVAVSSSSLTEAFLELEKKIQQDEINITQVHKAVNQIVAQPIKTIDDLGFYLAYCLSKQMKDQQLSVNVTPFTYQDTRMGSPFARFFQQVVETKVVEVAKWSVVKQIAGIYSNVADAGSSSNVADAGSSSNVADAGSSSNVADAGSSSNVADAGSSSNVADAGRDAYATGEGQAAFVITGTYWEQESSLKFITSLIRLSDGAITASVETTVENSVIQTANLSLKSQNFKEAFADQKVFRTDEVIGGGLMLEAWTDKGDENTLYAEGDTMKVFVRVNIPCNIRFIYHLADGARVLLLDNHYIDQSKVNKVYEIPEEFVCAPPFGAEVLQVFASTAEFEKAETKNVDGYDVLVEDLDKFLVKTRGMKKIKDDQKKILQAEQRIVITTMAK